MGSWKIKHLNTDHFIYLYFWDIQANNDLIIAIGYLALLWKHFFSEEKVLTIIRQIKEEFQTMDKTLLNY